MQFCVYDLSFDRHDDASETAVQRSSSLPLQCFSTTPIDGEDDDDKQDAVHWKSSRRQSKILSALQTYKELKGDTLVPRLFVIPSEDDRWPKTTWGYKLGNGVHFLRKKLKAGGDLEFPYSFLRELEELKFAQNVYQSQWDNAILPALCRFFEVNGRSDVPVSFVVPKGDEMWPEESWGWALGSIVSSIRFNKSYVLQVASSKNELDQINFCDSSVTERDWSERILPSLATYRKYLVIAS